MDWAKPCRFWKAEIEDIETDPSFYFETEYLYSPKNNDRFEYSIVNYADTLEEAQRLAQLYIAEMSEPIQKNKDY